MWGSRRKIETEMERERTVVICPPLAREWAAGAWAVQSGPLSIYSTLD